MARRPRISFRGADLLSLDSEEMRQVRGREIAMVFQDASTGLNPVLTVGRQVEEAILDRDTGAIIGQKVKNHPAVAVSNACWRNVRAFCSEFGLSPVSRTRLAIEQTDFSDADLTELLSRPRELKSVPKLL